MKNEANFFRFLGPFFIFSEIFASGILYFLLVSEHGHKKLSFTLKNKKEICNKNLNLCMYKWKTFQKFQSWKKN